MFGFIKYLQGFLDKLRRNKRVWFTIIFLISIFGIALSIFFLTIMTNKIAQEIYANQVSEYKLHYDTFVNEERDSLKKISLMLLNDKDFLESLKSDNNQAIELKLKDLNKNLVDNKFENTIIKYQDIQSPNQTNTVISAIKTKNSIFGLEVDSEGVYYAYLAPVVIEDVVVGVLEIRSAIDDVLADFRSINHEFVFFLNKSMASYIALDFKDANYQNFNDSLVFDKRGANLIVIKELGDLNFEEYRMFLDEGYTITENYYAANINIEDTNGIGLGAVVLVESKDKQHGLVHMINEMKNQVILIALGLIVSVLLFMF